jgi:hypothetical protein
MRLGYVVLSAAVLLIVPIVGQTSSAVPFVTQVAVKYPQLATVHSLTLTGTAEWISGSLHQSGTVSLQASADGSSTAQINMGTASRTETQTSLGDSRSCQWADAQGLTHQMDGPTCYIAVPWFAPALFIQPGPSVAGLLTISDDGQVVNNGMTLRQVSYVTPLKGKDPTAASSLTELTRVKLFFDPQTLLPISMEYYAHADNDSKSRIRMKVVFSDYRTVSGLPVPFHIDRYFNNTLQLSIIVSDASLNQ